MFVGSGIGTCDTAGFRQHRDPGTIPQLATYSLRLSLTTNSRIFQSSVQPVTGDKSVLDETDECLFVHTFRNSSNTGGWSRSVP